MKARRKLGTSGVYVMSDLVMKIGYVSFAAAAVIFVAMLLLTSLHP
jgi:hypothetical protein